MMSEHQAISSTAGKSVVTGLPGSSFQPQPASRRNLNPFHDQRDTQIAAKPLAKIRPVIGMGREAMMDMECHQRRRGFDPTQQMQEDHRIPPPGETDTAAVRRSHPDREKLFQPGKQPI